jgi:hypothetical protein
MLVCGALCVVEREFDRAIGQKKEELQQLDESLLRVRQLLQVGELRQCKPDPSREAAPAPAALECPVVAG